MSSGQPNVRTARFKQMLARLPAEVQAAADAAFTLFRRDPFHPVLANHELVDTKKGRHRKASRAVTITRRYRAIYVVDGSTNVWYWIGSHEDYNNFVGKI
ncbi:MAG: hypothetical protein AB7U73_22700 [Pirellulales bacterium]